MTPAAERFALILTRKDQELEALRNALDRATEAIDAAGAMGVGFPHGNRVREFLRAEREFRQAVSALTPSSASGRSKA